MVTRLRPGPDVATGPYAWFDAMMLAVSVAVGVAVLMVTSRWFADRSRGDSARRLRRAAHLVGWPWGAFALISLVSVAVFTATDASPVDVKSFLVIPLIMVLFAPLAYCAWVLLLRVRRDIDS